MRGLKALLLRHQVLLLWVAKAYALPRGCRVRRRADGIWEITRGRQAIWVASAHAPYIRDVIREFDYYFSAVTPTQVDGELVVDCTRPRLQQLDGLDQPILITGLPEPNATNQAYVDALNLPAGGVVIDGGAYCGASSLLFAKVVGSKGRVIAVEADPVNFSALQTNTEHSSVIERVPVALWSQAGTLTFASEGNMGSAVQADGGEVRPGGSRVSVEAITIAELIERCDLQRLDGIKLDIEGAEYAVLPTLGPVIERFHPRLVFELHANTTQAKESVLRALEGFGYRVSQVQQSENEGAPLIVAVPT